MTSKETSITLGRRLGHRHGRLLVRFPTISGTPMECYLVRPSNRPFFGRRSSDEQWAPYCLHITRDYLPVLVDHILQSGAAEPRTMEFSRM